MCVAHNGDCLNIISRLKPCVVSALSMKRYFCVKHGKTLRLSLSIDDFERSSRCCGFCFLGRSLYGLLELTFSRLCKASIFVCNFATSNVITAIPALNESKNHTFTFERTTNNKHKENGIPPTIVSVKSHINSGNRLFFLASRSAGRATARATIPQKKLNKKNTKSFT